MLNTFASLQHINQFDFQSAWEILSDNLRLYPECYESKAAFIASADEICNSFGEDPRLSTEDNEAIAAKVWDAVIDGIN